MPGPLGTRLQTSVIWTATTINRFVICPSCFCHGQSVKSHVIQAEIPSRHTVKKIPLHIKEVAQKMQSISHQKSAASSAQILEGISPEAAVFKHLISSADLAQLPNLFPVYLFEILYPVKMPAAIRSAVQCRKYSCAYELGKQRKLFQLCSKTERQGIGLGQANFSLVFSLLSSSSQVFIEMSLAFATSFPYGAWGIVWSGLDNTVIKQPKTTSDLSDRKNCQRKASLKEKNQL